MSQTERQKRQDYGIESEKGRLVNCAHCGGSGTSSLPCCIKSFGRQVSHANCHVCGGKGKTRV